ncbi:MAG: GIY-YIG nuclease family protein [Chitinophagaceae bacterium]
MHYVYIIESIRDGDFYKGSTEDYIKRLEQHNGGESQFTRSKIPWRLIFVREFESKKEALIEERRLKRCNKIYLQWLVRQPVNTLNNK